MPERAEGAPIRAAARAGIVDGLHEARVKSAGDILSLPQGGGAVKGLGEKFSPDLQTGTGNFSIPIAVPAGRAGLQPSPALAYSTGNGNSEFGLGWGLTLPGVTRRTSKGVPVYDDENAVPPGRGRRTAAKDRPPARSPGSLRPVASFRPAPPDGEPISKAPVST